MDNTRTRFVLAERCDDTSPCCDNTSPCALHDGSDANDCPGHPDGLHDWQPVWSINAAGRAYRCERCWDRTD